MLSKNASRTMQPLDWVLLIFLSLVWGGAFFFTEVALQEIRPFTLVLARVATAAIVLQVYVRIRGIVLPRDLHMWGSYAIMGLVNNVFAISFIFWGQSRIDSGLASILAATTPVSAVILTHIFTDDEKITINKLVGVIFGLAGVTILIGPTALHGVGADLPGQLSILAATFCYACAGIYGKRFRYQSALVTATGQMTCTTLMMIPVALLFEPVQQLFIPGWATIGSILALGILSTAIAYILYFRILASAGAANIALVNLLNPVSAILLGTLILHEPMYWQNLAGLGLIMFGLVALDGRIFSAIRVKTGRRMDLRKG